MSVDLDVGNQKSNLATCAFMSWSVVDYSMPSIFVNNTDLWSRCLPTLGAVYPAPLLTASCYAPVTVLIGSDTYLRRASMGPHVAPRQLS